VDHLLPHWGAAVPELTFYRFISQKYCLIGGSGASRDPSDPLKRLFPEFHFSLHDTEKRVRQDDFRFSKQTISGRISSLQFPQQVLEFIVQLTLMHA
jgi:hypothetical protein